MSNTKEETQQQYNLTVTFKGLRRESNLERQLLMELGILTRRAQTENIETKTTRRYNITPALVKEIETYLAENPHPGREKPLELENIDIAGRSSPNELRITPKEIPYETLKQDETWEEKLDEIGKKHGFKNLQLDYRYLQLGK